MSDAPAITTPGVYRGVPLEHYLGNPCPGPSISRSGLWLIESRSPAHYWATSPLNPQRAQAEESDALALGSAAHALLLEPEEFHKRFAVRPEDLDLRTKEGRAWRAEQEAAGRTILTQSEWETLRGIERAIKDHPLARRALEASEPEVTLAAVDEETGVWLKARPDALPRDPAKLPFSVQLKTTFDADPERFARLSVYGFGYHLGVALEIDLLAALGWHETPNVLVVAVEKAPPYAVSLVRLSDDAIAWGRYQYRRALRRFADCLASGRWPAYPEEVVEIGLPEWATRALQRDAETMQP